jgi:competence protein ComFC
MARAWGAYQGRLRSLLREFKYGGLKPLSGPLSELLETTFTLHFNQAFDWIAPVPLHRKRLRERGYDQALLLARGLSKKTGIPVLGGVIRNKETQPQYGLSSNERKLNTAGAFSLDRGLSLEECSILVLDDVFTTGSTVSSLCKCLRKKFPVRFIGVLTVARAIRHGPGN